MTADRSRFAPLRAAAVLAALSALSLATPALAQDKALAESLFNAGKTAMESGNHKTACKNFAESQKQDPSVGTLLNLGRCNERQGRLATAWGHYKEAARLAQVRGDTERSEAARKLASDLEPRLSKLTVSASAPVAGLVVARTRKEMGSDPERVEVGSGAMGVPIDVDPGQYTIEATAPGFETWSQDVTIGATSDRQSVDVPALTAAAAAPVEDTSQPPADTTSGDGSGLMTAGFIVGGVGVVGIGLGAIFGIVASSTASGAEDDPALCPNQRCTPAGREEIDSAETSATISTIGFGVGAAALVGGAVLVVMGITQNSGSQGSGGAETTAALPLEVTPVASPGGGGLWASGAF